MDMEPGIFLRLLEGITVRSLLNQPDSSDDELSRIRQVEDLLKSSDLPSEDKNMVKLSEEDKTKVAKALLESGLSFDQVAAVLDSFQN
jgi:hypothetical protein